MTGLVYGWIGYQFTINSCNQYEINQNRAHGNFIVCGALIDHDPLSRRKVKPNLYEYELGHRTVDVNTRASTTPHEHTVLSIYKLIPW